MIGFEARAGSRLARLLARTAIVFVGMAAGGTACAQDAGSVAEPATTIPTDDIVVTAQLRKQRLVDVPITIQAQTGEALARANITDARALEQIAPALNFVSGYNPTATSLQIRGAASVASSGGIQPSVGLVIDDVPVARQGEVVLDLAGIDRVEVLSGPQGTLFGKNATAGVVNIVSNRPRQTVGLSGEVTGTNDGEAIVKAMVNVPLTPNVAARLNGFYHYIDPLVHNLAGSDELGQESYGAKGQLLLNLSSTTDLLLNGSYTNAYSTFGPNFVIVSNAGALGVLQRQLLGPAVGRGADVVNQDSIAYNKFWSYSLIAELNSDLSSRLHLVTITAYRRFKSLSETDIDSGPTGVAPGRGFLPNPLNYPIQYQASYDVHSPDLNCYFSQEARLTYTAQGINLLLGAYYQNFDEDRLRKPRSSSTELSHGETRPWLVSCSTTARGPPQRSVTTRSRCSATARSSCGAPSASSAVCDIRPRRSCSTISD